ncbi:NusG domain II-containing protein [Anaeromassilibacillus senegalensis]|uniref:NusG domain II-containing protein n=1 Tax=Anaeromassilibacillus senegalensis TaxID=1673717 RepID=UPI00068076D9|nr:NusG domain II-containing protein [Anaeromassilibacillus senegalensis]
MSGRRETVRTFQKQDLLLIVFAVLLAAAAFSWFQLQPSRGLVAVVEQEGNVLYRIDLDQQAQTEILDLGGPYHVTLAVEPGAVAFQHSGCPDQTCVRVGKLTRAGQAAVCLPARISVRLEAADGEQAFDAYTGAVQWGKGP